MARQVSFRIVCRHPVDEPLMVEDGWRVSRIEETNNLLKVILIKDPRAS